jgi:hypothetical protein
MSEPNPYEIKHANEFLAFLVHCIHVSRKGGAGFQPANFGFIAVQVPDSSGTMACEWLGVAELPEPTLQDSSGSSTYFFRWDGESRKRYIYEWRLRVPHRIAQYAPGAVQLWRDSGGAVHATGTSFYKMELAHHRFLPKVGPTYEMTHRLLDTICKNLREGG